MTDITITAEEIKAANNIIFRTNNGEFTFRKVKHGEWQGGASCGLNMYGETIITPITCSECKYEVEEMSNFCPNCGADMRGERDE